MKKITFFKQISAISIITVLLTACATKGNNPEQYSNNSKMNRSGQGAVIGGILGALIGAATGNGGTKRVIVGGALGAALGGGIGYSMDQQAQEMAEKLETRVDNTPEALINPDRDLIVSNTDKYVKIMLRDSMVFETNKAIPTENAARKIAKITEVLKSYPNTLVQVVGFTDSRGSYEYNQKLSEQRASNVGNTIYNSGISNQIFSKGCSYNKPLVPNINSENMGLNRRIEIYLYANQQDVIDACIQ